MKTLKQIQKDIAIKGGFSLEVASHFQPFAQNDDFVFYVSDNHNEDAGLNVLAIVNTLGNVVSVGNPEDSEAHCALAYSIAKSDTYVESPAMTISEHVEEASEMHGLSFQNDSEVA